MLIWTMWFFSPPVGRSALKLNYCLQPPSVNLRVTYSSNQIGCGQVRPLTAKVEAILDYSDPPTRRELVNFSGWMGSADVLVETSLSGLLLCLSGAAQTNPSYRPMTVSMALTLQQPSSVVALTSLGLLRSRRTQVLQGLELCFFRMASAAPSPTPQSSSSATDSTIPQ